MTHHRSAPLTSGSGLTVTVESNESSLVADHDISAPHEVTVTEQLRLIDTSDLPLQHRLDMATRRRGLAHVAEIRRMLAAQAARRAA